LKGVDIMPATIDLTGKRFGKLTALYSVSNGKRRMWYCKCDCGEFKEKPVSTHDLKTSKVRSCGCLKVNFTTLTHSKSNTKLYYVWASMKQRCFNKNNASYHNYGGRGIVVCDDWLNFEPFYEWAMANGYKEGLTIERKDVNSNYESDNCTWIPKSEQALNTRANLQIIYKGETKSLSEWTNELNLDYRVTYDRLVVLRWDIKSAFETPLWNSYARLISYNGKTQNVAEWARELGATYSSLYKSLSRGNSLEEYLLKRQTKLHAR
jgi:hypothetical protein